MFCFFEPARKMNKKIGLLSIVLVVSIGFLSGCNEQTTDEGKAPVIKSFAATPASIQEGDISVLNWSVDSATSISIDNGIGNVAIGGSYTVTPMKTTKYIITATNEFGNSNASITVYVSSSPTDDNEPGDTEKIPDIAFMYTDLGIGGKLTISSISSETVPWSNIRIGGTATVEPISSYSGYIKTGQTINVTSSGTVTVSWKDMILYGSWTFTN